MSEIYEYKKINVSLEPPPDPHLYGVRRATIESAANRWAEMGWRTVAVVQGDREKGYADVLLVERLRKKESDGE